MKHTKLVALFMAIVMTMGLMTTAASACTADKDGNIAPCEKVEEDGYCDIAVITGIDWEAGVMYQWPNPYYGTSKPVETQRPSGGVGGVGEAENPNAPDSGLASTEERFDEVASLRTQYKDIIDRERLTIEYCDGNGAPTGYKSTFDAQSRKWVHFYPDGTQIATSDFGKLHLSASNPFADLEDDEPAETEKLVETQKPVKTFDDVPENAWYYNAVSSMTANGILNGYDDGLFHPENNITLGEMAVIIYQLASGENPVGKTGSPEGVYADVTWLDSTHWAAYAVNTLYTREVKYLYRPADHADDYVTRAEAIHAVYLLARETGHLDENNIVEKHNLDLDDKTVWPFINLHTYTDAELQERSGIPDLAINPDLGYGISTSLLFNVMRAYKYGLVHGVDAEGNCHPNDSLTRAELCQMLYNAGITGYTGPTNFKASKGWDKRTVTNQ